MTKNTNTPAATFAVGDRVTVTNAATMDEPMAGTLTAIKSGWYIVEADEEFENAKGEMTNTLSARVSSLAALTDESGHEEDGEEYFQSTRGEPLPYEADPEEGDVEDALTEAEKIAHKMAEALRAARVRYTKDRRPFGAATAHNGDVIAKELRDYEPLEVAALADRCLDQPKGFHADRYSSLNNGQIRMNCGNKIRAAYRKACEADASDAAMATLKARIEFVLGLDSDAE